MTSKQLERKVGQLYSRKKLVDTVEELEEAIKTFMLMEGKTDLHTEKFIIRLVEGRLDISVRTSIDPNQLALNFKPRPNPKDKEDFNNENIDPQETIARRAGLSEGCGIKTRSLTDS